MFTYSQSTGVLTRSAQRVGLAYSGHGPGLNNPAMQDRPGLGPLQRGMYTIGPAFTHESKGPVVMHLTPAAATEEYGRSGFLIHGDNLLLDHSGSEGCIVTSRPVREAIAACSDRKLLVVP